MLNNIFELAEYQGVEDRFTAAWGYLLNREPQLAQAVADILLESALPSAVRAERLLALRS
jgi:hypothetical protein